MPFQSEKQRRYLWANEPEIARDWTDTYGSRIQKNNGGLTSIRQPYFSGGDIIKMGLKQILASQAKKKAQEYGYLPQPTQKKSTGSFLARMLANMFLGPVAGLAWDVGSGIMSNRKGSFSVPNFNMSAVDRTSTNRTSRTPTAQQQFMQTYNVHRDPQTGRMTSGPFAGQNLFGASAFGSKTAKEQAQRNLDKWGKTAPQEKIDEWTKIVGGDTPTTKTVTKPTPKHSPHHHHGGGNGGSNGTGGKGSSPSDAPGTPFNRGGLAALWQR